MWLLKNKIKNQGNKKHSSRILHFLTFLLFGRKPNSFQSTLQQNFFDPFLSFRERLKETGVSGGSALQYIMRHNLSHSKLSLVLILKTKLTVQKLHSFIYFFCVCPHRNCPCQTNVHPSVEMMECATFAAA